MMDLSGCTLVLRNNVWSHIELSNGEATNKARDKFQFLKLRNRDLEEILIYEKRNKQINLILYCISSVFHSVSYWLYEWK